MSNIEKITNLDLLKFGGGTNNVNSYNIDTLFQDYNNMFEQYAKQFQLTIDRPNDENAIKDPEIVFNYFRHLQNEINEIFLKLRTMSKSKIKEYSKQIQKRQLIDKTYDFYHMGIIILTNLRLEEFQINYLRSYYNIITNYIKEISRIFKKAHYINNAE